MVAQLLWTQSSFSKVIGELLKRDVGCMEVEAASGELKVAGVKCRVVGWAVTGWISLLSMGSLGSQDLGSLN
jgi:hypothetical protein